MNWDMLSLPHSFDDDGLDDTPRGGFSHDYKLRQRYIRYFLTQV